MNARPVGIDSDGNGIWQDADTGERYNSGEPLTDEERREVDTARAANRETEVTP